MSKALCCVSRITTTIGNLAKVQIFGIGMFCLGGLYVGLLVQVPGLFELAVHLLKGGG